MILERLRQQAAAHPRRVLLPEGDDPRVLDAARQLAARQLAIPLLIAAPAMKIPGAEVLAQRADAAQWQSSVDEALGSLLAANGRNRGQTAISSGKWQSDPDFRGEPLMRAAALLRLGYADVAVMGSVATTAHVLRCGLRGLGLAPGIKLVSSFFLMELGERVLTYADCAVVPDPDPAQLAQIAVTSAASHRRLTGETPKVALLSFSTRGSAQHARVAKVQAAVALARQLAPDLDIDGELQFDAAFVPDVAARKAPGSTVAGQANVFVFPDLDSGNLGYKITERLGGANAIGPILQGLAKPWMDLSRGCKVEDIVNTAVVASVLSGAPPPA